MDYFLAYSFVEHGSKHFFKGNSGNYIQKGKKSKLENIITKYWLMYSILWIQMIPKHIIKELNEYKNLCRKTDWYPLTIKGKMTLSPKGKLASCCISQML